MAPPLGGSRRVEYSSSSGARSTQRNYQLDGPASNTSQTGSQAGSQTGSQAGSRSGKQVFQRSRVEIPRNIDFGPQAYLFQSEYDAPKKNMLRPGFVESGKDIKLRINSHRVLEYPSSNVYQYDVIIGNGDEKRALNSAVWASKELKNSIGGGWIYDGAKIAWTNRPLGQNTFTVDMDREKGRQPNPNRTNRFRVQIKQVKTLGLQGLMAYMRNTADFTIECLEAINFLDHLMREFPSRRLISIKRSFFDKALNDSMRLGAGISAVKGIYQSLRPAMGGLVVNADVANQCFWDESSVYSTFLALSAPTQEHQVMENMRRQASGAETRMYRNVQRLKKVRITVSYPNMPEKVKNKVFVIDLILRTNARDTMFTQENKDTGATSQISVLDYFFNTYRVRIQNPHMPIVQCTGKNSPKYPMEFCTIVKGQKYPFKLSDIQTSQMIKFAVTRPAVREKAISAGRELLKWHEDLALKTYGLKIDGNMLETKAKLLQPPKVEFAGGKSENPGTSGRWRLDGKQFIQPNPQALNVWTVMIFNDWGSPRDRVNKAEVDHFLSEFQRLFKSHGGKINRGPAVTEEGNVNSIPDSISSHWNRARTITKGLEPQLMVFIVTAKNSAHYNRLKRQCDNRFGCVSQVMQSAHVKRCQPQYIGNVLLKVFAKLGGFGFRACPSVGKLGAPFAWFSQPTMIVGADVSHGGAGSMQSSIASMTVSMDRIGCRYYAMVQSNGMKEEMVTTWNIRDMLMPAFREWMMNVNGGNMPKHLIYFRDGVSEGEYQHVLQREVRDMKAVWEELDSTAGKIHCKDLKFTVVVASKRHHVRFFPSGPGAADRNGNAMPGTLVERDVTHPREYDFYLCSHSAIQGTARPVHYHVLMDEAKMPPTRFVNLIYNHSYQYARSTTPVSVFPAIYYAHLAAKRAVAHDRDLGEERGDFTHSPSDKKTLVELQEARSLCDRTGKIMTKNALQRLAELERRESPTLLPLGPPRTGPQPPDADGTTATNIPDPRRFKWSMWYI